MSRCSLPFVRHILLLLFSVASQFWKLWIDIFPALLFSLKPRATEGYSIFYVSYGDAELPSYVHSFRELLLSLLYTIFDVDMEIYQHYSVFNVIRRAACMFCHLKCMCVSHICDNHCCRPRGDRCPEPRLLGEQPPERVQAASLRAATFSRDALSFWEVRWHAWWRGPRCIRVPAGVGLSLHVVLVACYQHCMI